MTYTFRIFVQMKMYIAIAFMIIYVFSTTEVHQFLKTPALFEHFYEHQSKEKNLTFLHFLYLHYKNNNKDADYDKDLKLPFKTIENCSPSIHIVLQSEIQVEIKTIFTSIKKKSIRILYKSIFYSNYLDSIWQPPKL